MLSPRAFNLPLLISAFVILLTLSLHAGKSNANPLTPTLFARQDDETENPYPTNAEIREAMTITAGNSVFFSGCPEGSTEAYRFSLTVNDGAGRIVRNTFPTGFTKQIKPKNNEQYQDFMNRFSLVFAEESSGTAYFVSPIDGAPRDCSIWTTIEEPVLIADGGAVSEIIQVDCEDFDRRQTIFTRNEETKRVKRSPLIEKRQELDMIEKRQDIDVDIETCYEDWHFDEQWEITFHSNDLCTGETISKADVAISKCRNFIEDYRGFTQAITVEDLTDECSIVLYSDLNCVTVLGAAVAEDVGAGCLPASGVLSFRAIC